jgi:predicted nucleic acid-binding protein
LSVDERVAEVWARLGIPHPPTAVDGLIAATAIVHGLTVVTRNVADLARTGVMVFDPFSLRP